MCPKLPFVDEILSNYKAIIKNNIEYSLDNGYTFGTFINNVEYKSKYYHGYVFYDNLRAEKEIRSIFGRAFHFKNLLLEKKEV